ncbi:MAG: ATP-binding protein [Pseudomonadales bacterium]
MSSIAMRVSAPFFAVLVITAFLLLWVLPERQEQALLETTRSEMEGAALSVALSIATAIEEERLDILPNINDYLARASGVSRVAVYLEEGGEEVLLLSFPAEADDLNRLEDRDQFLIKEQPLRGLSVVGRVVVGFEREDFQERLNALVYPSYLAFLGLVLLQAVILGIVRRNVVSPVTQSIATASRLGEGDLDLEVPSDAVSDELRSLQQALEQLRVNLSNQRSENQQLLQSLELRVEERTEALSKALNAKNELLANVSHELRTPLHGIIASLDLLSLTISSEQFEARDYLGHATASTETLLRLINQILEFQSNEAHGVSLQLEAFSLDQFVKKLERMGVRLFQDSTVNFVVDAQGYAGLVPEGDEHRLLQIMSNLITNARKYTESGEVRVMLTARREGQGSVLEVVVKDTGIGMSQQLVSQLGEPFVRGATQRWQGEAATGLGLSIVKQLLVSMGSRLLVESTEGLGSRLAFTILFERTSERPHGGIEEENPTALEVDLGPRQSQQPLQDQDSRGSVEPTEIGRREVGETVVQSSIQSAEGLISNSSVITMLYVEDTALNRTVMKAMMAKLPIALDMAESAQEGFRMIRSKQYDLVISDIQMPDFTGLDLIQWIRAEPDLNDLRVFAFTANADKDAIERYEKAGFETVLTKPLTFDQLRGKLAPWLERLQS